MTAIIAALLALAGVLICRWTLGIPILAPKSEGAWGDANTATFMLVVALVVLAATGLLHLMMLATPEPARFLGWIMGVVTLVSVVYPFSTGAPLNQKIATSVVVLVIGVAVTSLLSGIASRAVRRVRDARRESVGRGYDGRGPDPRYGDPRYGDPRYGDRGPDPRYADRGPDPRYGDRYGDRDGYGDRYGDRGGYDRGGDRPDYERRGYDVHDQRTMKYPPDRDSRW